MGSEHDQRGQRYEVAGASPSHVSPRGGMIARLDVMGFLRSMDTNGDGVIAIEEVPEHRRPMLQMMASRMGIDASKGVTISKIRDTMMGRRPQGDESRGRDDDKKKSDSKRIVQKDPLVPPFGTDEEPPKLPDFGERVDAIKRVDLGSGIEGATSKVDRHMRSYVQSMLKRFDRNHNHVLERSEWEGKPDNPGDKDRDHDGRITVSELAYRPDPRERFMRGRMGGMMGMGGMGGGDRYDDEDDSEEDEDKETRRASYRFLMAHERLPGGLPDWFVDRDTDLDGQVSMAEYARDWSDSVASEYLKYDANNDGIITPKECLSPSGGHTAAETPSGSPGSPPPPKEDGASGDAKPSGDDKPSGGSSKPWWMQP